MIVIKDFIVYSSWKLWLL